MTSALSNELHSVLVSPIVHQLVGPIEHPGSAEGGRLAVDSGRIHDSGPAERSPHQGYRFSTDHIVDHLVGNDDS